MKLLAAGCSLIYGSELVDEKPHDQGYSQLTYPALLAKHLNLEYQCAARPGFGNDAIARTMLDNFDETVSLVIINWSYIDRFEFHYKDIGWQNIKDGLDQGNYLTDQICKLAKPFYSDLTPEYSYYRYLEDIFTCQEFLNKQQVPYIFSSTDRRFVNQEYIVNLGTAHKNLYNAIDFSPWFFWKTNQTKTGFLEWATQNNYPRGVAGHPLESAHRDTYELIKKDYDNSN